LAGSNETPNENPVLRAILTAFGSFAALVALIYVFGGLVLYLRLQIRHQRTDVVVATLPREFLISVGLAVLAQFGFYLLFLLGAFVQQVEPSTRIGGINAKLARAIRVLLVLGATLVLAIPLSRWIELRGWWYFKVAVVVFLGALILPFAASVVRWPRQERENYRWGVPLCLIGVLALVVGLVAIFAERGNKSLEVALIVLSAVFTSGVLWLLLMKLVDPFPRPQPAEPNRGLWWQAERRKRDREFNRRDFLRRAGLLTVLAFIIFIPWRAALEAASVAALDTKVCTTAPTDEIKGLYIGANNDRVYLGETGDVHRIAEIPRNQITRVYVGKGAQNLACLWSLQSITVNPKAVVAGTKVTGTVALKGIAPAIDELEPRGAKERGGEPTKEKRDEGVVITVSSSNPAAVVVPPKVLILDGHSVETFTITTKRRGKTPTAVIIASTHGAVKTATLTVKSPNASR
jgi:hypothetical protein